MNRRLLLLTLLSVSACPDPPCQGTTKSGGECTPGLDTAVDGDTDADTDTMTDADGDQFSPPDDCDDGDPAVNPDAVDGWLDGRDSNCDGIVETQPSEVGLLIAGDRVGAGFGVSFAVGRVNDDEYNDLWVGAWDLEAASLGDDGRAWLFLGPIESDVSTSDAVLELIGGVDGVGALGSAMALLDLDGDDCADLILGDYSQTVEDALGGTLTNAGAVYVIQSPGCGGSPSDMWSPATSSTGVELEIRGSSNLDRVTTGASSVGDLDGDDAEDFLIEGNSVAHGDGVYLFSSAQYLNDKRDIVYVSEDYDWAVTSDGLTCLPGGCGAGENSTVGDWSGTGAPQLALASRFADKPGGANGVGVVAIVELDSTTSLVSLGDVGTKVWGDTTNGQFGINTAAGDLTDGGADMLAVAGNIDEGSETANGKVWGLSDPAVDTIEDARFTISEGAAVQSARLGTMLEIADFDGDGIDDLIVGDPEASSTNGAAWLFLSEAGGLTGDLTTDDADAVLIGENAGGRLGGAAATGDLDGDGVLDLLVSGRGVENDLGIATGGIWVLFGN